MNNPAPVIEKLPHTIVSNKGVKSYLRIKQGTGKKKWRLRYIRPAEKSFYKTTLRIESATLNGAAKKMQRLLIINGYTTADGAKLIHNNYHEPYFTKP